MSTEHLWLLIATPYILILGGMLAIVAFGAAIVLLDKLFLTPVADSIDRAIDGAIARNRES